MSQAIAQMEKSDADDGGDGRRERGSQRRAERAGRDDDGGVVPARGELVGGGTEAVAPRAPAARTTGGRSTGQTPKLMKLVFEASGKPLPATYAEDEESPWATPAPTAGSSP